MFFEIVFWILLALFVLPLPFKIYGYVNGTDKSPTIVKAEEFASAVFLAIGLIPFYGYLHDVQIYPPIIWRVWFVVSIIWLILSFFWSPKLAYASSVMGKSNMRIFAMLSFLLYAPLFYAVFLHAF